MKIKVTIEDKKDDVMIMFNDMIRSARMTMDECDKVIIEQTEIKEEVALTKLLAIKEQIAPIVKAFIEYGQMLKNGDSEWLIAKSLNGDVYSSIHIHIYDNNDYKYKTEITIGNGYTMYSIDEVINNYFDYKNVNILFGKNGIVTLWNELRLYEELVSKLKALIKVTVKCKEDKMNKAIENTTNLIEK